VFYSFTFTFTLQGAKNENDTCLENIIIADITYNGFSNIVKSNNHNHYKVNRYIDSC